MHRIIAAQLSRQEIFETLLMIIFYSAAAPHRFVDPGLLRGSVSPPSRLCHNIKNVIPNVCEESKNFQISETPRGKPRGILAQLDLKLGQ
jgi:hypothetical protein